MAYYQLLQPADNDSGYRGTYRIGPYPDQTLPDDAPINRLWHKYVEINETITECNEAVELAMELEGAGYKYDVVRIDFPEEAPLSDPPGFLGYDVSAFGWYSFLSEGLRWDEASETLQSRVDPLLRLVSIHFRPKLNRNGLFSLWEDADFFRQVLISISELAPGTWESGDVISGIQLVRLVDVRPGSRCT